MKHEANERLCDALRQRVEGRRLGALRAAQFAVTSLSDFSKAWIFLDFKNTLVKIEEDLIQARFKNI